MMVQDCITHVPLIIKPANGVTEIRGHQTTALVESIDLFPTLADLYGIPLRHNQFGRSLRSALEGKSFQGKDAVFTEGGYGSDDTFTMNSTMLKGTTFMDDPNAVYSRRLNWEKDNLDHMGRFVAIRTNKWKYIRRENDPEELYDLVNDPNETINTFEAMKDSAIVFKLKESLLNFYMTTADSVSHQIDNRLCAASWTSEKGLKKLT